MPLAHVARGVYTVTLPAEAVKADFEYYVQADGRRQIAGLPADGPGDEPDGGGGLGLAVFFCNLRAESRRASISIAGCLCRGCLGSRASIFLEIAKPSKHNELRQNPALAIGFWTYVFRRADI